MESNKYIDFVDMWNLIEATSTEFFYDRLAKIGLHRGQPKMLRFLGENDGCRQKDIADRFFLRAASVSGVLNTLEKQGLIERRQNPRSRRETLIYLTEQGKDKLVQVHKFYEEINELWFEDFSEDEIRNAKHRQNPVTVRGQGVPVYCNTMNEKYKDIST